MKDFIKKVQSDSSITWLFAGFCFLLGLVFGFLFSPVKKGVSIGNNNTSIGSGVGCKTPCKKDDFCGFDDDDDEVKF